MSSCPYRVVVLYLYFSLCRFSVSSVSSVNLPFLPPSLPSCQPVVGSLLLPPSPFRLTLLDRHKICEEQKIALVRFFCPYYLFFLSITKTSPSLCLLYLPSLNKQKMTCMLKLILRRQCYYKLVFFCTRRMPI